MVCIWPLPTGQQYQHTPPYSKLWQQKKMSSYTLQMSLGVKINLHREPLIETFSHTEANWTLRLDKYIIIFLFFFAGWQGAHWVNHDIYEKVWLQLEIFHEGKSIGNRTAFPKVQITGLISHSWCSPVAALIQLSGKTRGSGFPLLTV